MEDGAAGLDFLNFLRGMETSDTGFQVNVPGRLPKLP